MKTTFFPYAIVFLAALVVASGLVPMSGTTLAAASPPGAQSLDKSDQTPPVSAVSPARPDAPTPRGGWCCDRCGAENPFPRQHLGKRHGRPTLGQRGFRGHRPHQFRQHRGMTGKRNMVAAERLLNHADQLELTKDQIAKLEELAYKSKEQLIELRAEMDRERLEMQRLNQSDSDDLSAYRKHLNAMAKTKVSVQEARIANRIEAKKILTDEQKQKLEEKFPGMCGKR